MRFHVSLFGLLVFSSGLLLAAAGLSAGLAAFGLGGDVFGQDPRLAALLEWLGLLYGGLLFLFGALEVPIGVGILRRRSWGRALGFVVSVVHVIAFPIGTLFGVYGFWTLGAGRMDFTHPTEAPESPGALRYLATALAVVLCAGAAYSLYAPAFPSLFPVATGALASALSRVLGGR